MAAQLTVGSRRVGEGQPVYVIAEAGVNHNGSVDLALDLIKLAKSAGADAIKFQTFDPKSLVVAGADTAEYQRQQTGMADQQKMLSDLALPATAWPILHDAAVRAGIDFLSTPFDSGSLDLLVGMGVSAIKVSSGDLTNHRLLRAVRRTGLPAILSTGASSLAEVSDAVEAMDGSENLALLHCVTAYPSPIDQSNLLSIRTMADNLGCVVGWSDHSVGSLTAIAAVALGASLIEKHITLDSTMPGPDHSASADPNSFSRYMDDIRSTVEALGNGEKRPQPSEIGNRSLARRGLYATRPISPGETVTPGDFLAQRPQAGLPASFDVTAKVATRSIEVGDPLQANDLESPS